MFACDCWFVALLRLLVCCLFLLGSAGWFVLSIARWLLATLQCCCMLLLLLPLVVVIVAVVVVVAVVVGRPD